MPDRRDLEPLLNSGVPRVDIRYGVPRHGRAVTKPGLHNKYHSDAETRAGGPRPPIEVAFARWTE